MSDRVRLSVDMDRQLYETLVRIAEKTDRTHAGLMRRAFALYSVAAEHVGPGERLAIVGVNGEVKTFIIGIT